MSEISDTMLHYIAVQDARRDERVNRALDALTDRERALVEEAAVMGYVQGVMAARARDFAIPSNRAILWHVILGCQSFDDLYPTIGTLLVASDDEGEGGPSDER